MTAPHRDASGAWTALLLLATGFLMSQAFRTIAAIMAAPLQAELQLTPQQLGTFAAAYHFAFGGLQLFMGMGIDLHGLRRTVLTASPLMALGAAVSALATGFPMLVAGQVLIGIGSAPAFLVCTIYVARHFAPERYTVVSSLILAVGGIGMLLTGSPLAWLIEATSWRMGFWVLAGCALLSWLAIALGVREPAPATGARRETLGQALRGLVAMRAKEGEALLVDFLGRLEKLHAAAEAIAHRAPQISGIYREQLMQRLRQAGLELDVNDERVLKEVALFADRADITEEITRLRHHLTQLKSLLTAEGEVGRKAEFILQEIGREIHTIGSKANDLAISQKVIEFKNELERIKEQIANVE